MCATRVLPAVALLLAGGLAGSPALADEPRYNQVSLRADVSSEVARDRMHVTLYTESQSQDPAELAAQTTRTLNAAIERARQSKAVVVSQGSRGSYPVYGDDGERISGWRERAELRLESTDFAALSELTAELMKSLKMGDMHFSVSDAIVKQNEDALIKDAVTAFRARADLATQALGGSDYRIVSLDLGGGQVQPMPRGMAMKAMMEAAPTPEIEAGTQQLTVHANGVIEVQLP